MKVKIKDIVMAKAPLDMLSANRSLPTKTSYKIYVLLQKLSVSLNFFETKKSELFAEMGQPDGDSLVIPTEKKDKFLAKLEEISGFECDEEIEKISLDLNLDLGLSPTDLKLLEPFFEYCE